MCACVIHIFRKLIILKIYIFYFHLKLCCENFPIKILSDFNHKNDRLFNAYNALSTVTVLHICSSSLKVYEMGPIITHLANKNSKAHTWWATCPKSTVSDYHWWTLIWLSGSRVHAVDGTTTVYPVEEFRLFTIFSFNIWTTLYIYLQSLLFPYNSLRY